MSIPQLTLQSGWQIPMLGLGTWRLKGDECTLTVRRALEMGYTHIDTADMYDNHAAVGKALQGFDRASLFITSKVGPEDLRHDGLIAACERNLRELGLDYLDMYLMHWPNPHVEMAESFEALRDLQAQGKIRSIGVSNFVVERLAQAIDVSPLPICTNQVEFHPLLYQRDLLEFCNGHGIAVTAYAPLARTQALNNDVIRAVASQCGKTPAQVCLRWLVQKGIIVIPKTASKERLRENMAIFDWELSADDERRIDAIPGEKRLIQGEYAEF